MIVDHDEEMKKLGIHQMPKPRPPWPTGKTYGLGLKESKDWIDRYLSRKATTTTA